MKGAAVYEIALRELRRFHEQPGKDKPTPVEKTYAPGSVEHRTQQATLVPHRQQLEYIRNTAGNATLANFHEDWDPVGEKMGGNLHDGDGVHRRSREVAPDRRGVSSYFILNTP